MLTYCDFVYASEHTTFSDAFRQSCSGAELGTSYSLPAQIGYIAAAELILLDCLSTRDAPFEAWIRDASCARSQAAGYGVRNGERLAQQPRGRGAGREQEADESALRATNRAAAKIEVRGVTFPPAVGGREGSPDGVFEKRKPDFTPTKTALQCVRSSRRLSNDPHIYRGDVR